MWSLMQLNGSLFTQLLVHLDDGWLTCESWLSLAASVEWHTTDVVCVHVLSVILAFTVSMCHFNFCCDYTVSIG